jgi:hypothetical protein
MTSRSALLACAWLLCAALWAGDGSAVEGLVRDVRGRLMAGAEVRVQSESTGARWKCSTDDEGHFAFSALPPGLYKVTVRSPGFRTVTRGDARLAAGSTLALEFTLELLALHEVITVVSARDDIDPSAGDSLLLSRSSPGAALPVNGSDLRASFDLLPGVVITPAQVSDAGQFTTNGQRPNQSEYRLDGVSANTGVGGSGLPGSFPGASLPGMNLLGTTESLATPETTQSVELQTSAFAPEFGERPGAKVFVSTRSGANELRGEFFAQWRGSHLQTHDWFANSLGLADLDRPNYHRLGGVLSGALRRNRTFFFAGGESAALNSTGVQLVLVPSAAARAATPTALGNMLNTFPLPVGTDFGDGTAVGNGQLARTASLENYSLRLDHTLNAAATFFLRIADSPSSASSNNMFYDVSSGRLHWSSLTAGATTRMGGWIHESRFNFSRSRLSTHLSDMWAPAFSLAGFTAFQASMHALGNPDAGATMQGLSVAGLGQFIGGAIGNPRQDQWEVRHAAGRIFGRHNLRLGMDYIRLSAMRHNSSATLLGVVSSLDDLLAGGPVALTYLSTPRAAAPTHIGSLFVQDTIRLNDRLSLLYGLGWELTPPTPLIYTSMLTGRWPTDIGALSTNLNGAAAWPMRYGQVAPRFGLAWRPPAAGLVLRAGAGLFHDTALGASLNPVNGAPFNSWLLSSGVIGSTGGGAGSIGSWPKADSEPEVVRFLAGNSPPLQLPVSAEWRAGLERDFGRQGVAAITYTGSAGAHLLGSQAYVSPVTNVLKHRLMVTEASSRYHALQARYSGTVTPHFYVTASYSWAHSIDTGSQDSAVFLIHPGYRLDESRASSSFDVRHALTGAFSYHLAGWTLSSIVRARGGFPVDLYTGEPALGQSFYNVGHPNVVAGVPVWLADGTIGGGRRLNPAAFSVPADGAQGTLGRNAIRGRGLAQWDASLRREFTVYRGIRVEAVVSLYNVLNHPAFADPLPYLSSPLFGLPTSMQNLMLGSGTPNTGLPALFQSGGARSAELSFRVMF